MSENYNKNNQCPYCGKFFNYLGIANHRARCREKYFNREDTPEYENELKEWERGGLVHPHEFLRKKKLKEDGDE